MSDTEMTLAELKTRVLAFAQEREWLQFHSPKNLSMAIAAESAELMEHFLWADSEDSHKILDGAKRGQIEDELADIVIYSMEFANVAGIDLSTAIAAKMEQNARKYPVEKARGRSNKYNEL
ncbi:nucleotide pyrophosphohydrolase [Rubellicoccus peritrichatus]|uniref:Nucleotide pyrophosphohydrolase n=1 Tax=Rubellicoccus peritrichatus TaxID=3080537 RepID=A0AAQ3QTY8_9BACT|nr:nucleotide pyrophosphohydrolase [Puniceicoccus sp. CR14]WOO41851.1 nucleotide pyrophosphohydrolase [Puniceicoccus sp. CR14]